MTTTTTEATTVLAGLPHPGTPLRVLRNSIGFFLGFLTEEGELYSCESIYFGGQLECSWSLDMLQMGSAPLNQLLVPAGVPRSTPNIQRLLTGEGQFPVRGDTESAEDFIAPMVEAIPQAGTAMPTVAATAAAAGTLAHNVEVQTAPPPVDDPLVKEILRGKAEELGIDWLDEWDVVTLAHVIEDTPEPLETDVITEAFDAQVGTETPNMTTSSGGTVAVYSTPPPDDGGGDEAGDREPVTPPDDNDGDDLASISTEPDLGGDAEAE